ncbi:hypothetical protein GCM10011282_19320 [Undibacterium macrobrachii]|uniref:Uncharacterized protein n=1 Tax=Undibacterium macrobrachii TaxID=1119058 RepID=A0ABQ2XEM0_9BURK|nr:hypothetical protein GCM10011282_19320 [Undibacterium macrobrachii]
MLVGIAVPLQVKITLTELKGSLALKLILGISDTPVDPFSGEITAEIVGAVVSPGVTTTGAFSTVKLVIRTLDPNLLPAKSFVLVLSTVAVHAVPYGRL